MSVLPIGDLGDDAFCLSLSDLNPGDTMLESPLLCKSPKSREPFLIIALIADASVLENYALYGSLTNPVLKPAFEFAVLAGNLNCSNKLDDCLGLKVRPREYFSPDGDLGGVNPF